MICCGQRKLPFMEYFIIEGAAPGPTLLILGGVHGNEPCGVKAIRRFLAAPQPLEKGRIVCIPAVNEPALAADKRFIDRNLNRILGESDAGDSEGRIAEALKPFLRDADYLLDLHSYSAGGPPFVFAAVDGPTMAFAGALPAAALITGWQDSYARAFPDRAAPGIGTTEYARAHGCVAVTYECGQHRDPLAPHNGYEAILAARGHVGAGLVGHVPLHIAMSRVFVKEKPGALARPWKHLQPISKGEAYAWYEDGRAQTAPENGYVILPFGSAETGGEWGYFGQKETGSKGPARVAR